jgi:non-specific serine/threonine protein kinase
MGRAAAPPSPGTTFVGRERELDALRDVLGRDRLLTLHGAGGAGKTRLAVELVRRSGGAVAFADLAPLARDAPLWPELARLLGVREEPGLTLPDAVVRAAAPDLLLILDNCEHVRDGARDVAMRLLAERADVTIVATSREPLGHDAERVFPVPPLRERDATDLFADRAARALPGFTLSAKDVGAVERIGSRLDGMPLAIELAAARVTVLGPVEIAERLDDRFRLLARDDPALPSRQRTLRALVDWSYELLMPAEQQLLAQLAVFAGGFEVDAAEAVCRADGEIIDLLGRLVDKALVARGERDGRARLRLHETIREYAAERLDDTESVSARHLDWCRAMITEADDALTGSTSIAWPDRARAELDNVRKAEEWGLAAGRSAEALDLAWRSANFMQLWGRADECAGWLARGLEATSDAPPSVDRARALVRAGDMFASSGRWSRAREYFEGSLALGTELGDPARRAIALLSLAEADCAQGALEPARRAAEEGLRTIRATGDRERTRWLVEMLGIIDLAAGDAATARERFEASRDEAVALGKESLLAVTTQLLGEAEREAGDRVGARMHLEEALALATRHGERIAEGEALLSLGRLDGDESRLAAALRVAEHAGVRPLALNCLDALAQARAERGDARAAAALLGAVTAFRETLATPPEPREHARLDRLRARLEQALGAEPFAAAFGAGRARAWPEAVADALRAPAAAPPVGQVVLRREGDVWAITSGGRQVRLRDSKGLQYLATLIAAPGHDHHVLELAGSALDEPAPAALDDAARAAYRHRLAELEEEIDEAERFADPERVARLHGERDALYGELRSAIGLGGRPRAGGSAERARKAVTNRLRDAVARIEREDAELAAHLRASVHTGIVCAYRPEPHSTWSLRVE